MEMAMEREKQCGWEGMSKRMSKRNEEASDFNAALRTIEHCSPNKPTNHSICKHQRSLSDASSCLLCKGLEVLYDIGQAGEWNHNHQAMLGIHCFQPNQLVICNLVRECHGSVLEQPHIAFVINHTHSLVEYLVNQHEHAIPLTRSRPRP
jgi:hypothetical protein